MGYTPGVKAPVIPDEVGVLDGGDVVEGVGGENWRRVVECGGLFYVFDSLAESAISHLQG